MFIYLKLYNCRPSLHSYYRSFCTTMATSDMLLNIGTISLSGIARLRRSLCILAALPVFPVRARIRFMPAQLRLPYDQHTSSRHSYHPPPKKRAFDKMYNLSQLHHRFTCVHLPYPYLTGFTSLFPLLFNTLLLPEKHRGAVCNPCLYNDYDRPTIISYRTLYSKYKMKYIHSTRRVGHSISATASHRTVLDSLPSHGSCYTNRRGANSSQ